MSNSTFSGPVRSVGGFTVVTAKDDGTTQASISSTGVASLDANTMSVGKLVLVLPQVLVLFTEVL